MTLPRDALVIGSDNHPYLRYVNVKLRREAVIPIGPVLVEQLRRQEESLTAVYGPDGTDFLLPSPPEGMRGPSRGGRYQHHAADGSPDRQGPRPQGRDPRQPGPPS